MSPSLRVYILAVTGRPACPCPMFTVYMYVSLHVHSLTHSPTQSLARSQSSQAPLTVLMSSVSASSPARRLHVLMLLYLPLNRWWPSLYLFLHIPVMMTRLVRSPARCSVGPLGRICDLINCVEFGFHLHRRPWTDILSIFSQMTWL